MIDQAYLDWAVSKPYFLLLSLNVAGLVIGLYKMIDANPYQVLMLLINLGWIAYNLVILFAAMAVCVESVQKRKFPRVAFETPVLLEVGDKVLGAKLCAFSQRDCVVSVQKKNDLVLFGLNQKIKLTFGTRRHPGYQFSGQVTALFEGEGIIEILVEQPTRQKEMEYVSATFGTPDIWIRRQEKVKSYGMYAGACAILRMSWCGVKAFLNYSSPHVGWLFKAVTGFLRWIISFIPRFPRLQKLDKNSPFESEYAQIMR